ncbi:SDR family NAD(P)-dependent oxidoreductase [Sinirhodobacter populi]|uniref:SDR family NAD(P)-dependent oxidoreductase n=1 Tax=Paenirhodobacter populi TaxID=2306993 RepID=A0A443K5B7_9RHOB|nr:SDR family NAD(P)-dependent oxidoreductase [Sinirhodobacter populi]RWR27969.1 SDR family NAD(P)-dependent oxidoreductase [Sinirhodobacter populi]
MPAFLTLRRPAPSRAMILTGATGGLGLALTGAFAAPGLHMLLAGRDPDRLAEAERIARAGGAIPELLTVPLTEPRAFAAAIADYDRRHPVDLLLLNAGVKTGNDQGEEPLDQTERVIAVNLTSAFHAVQALLPGMRQRGRGQIALTSSMAALSPHADLLSYTATKAALRGYGAALRRNLRGSGVRVSVITPGFIDTPMTDRQIGPAPMMIPPDRAARIIRNGLARGRANITFPLLLCLLIRLENLLPKPVADLIDRHYRGTIIPDPDEKKARGEGDRPFAR